MRNLNTSGGVIFSMSTAVTTTPLEEDMAPFPFSCIHSYTTGCGGSLPYISLTIAEPVS